MMFDNLSGAEFSPCGKYRYALWRIWDEAKPNIMFIGLNPSTATASMDDPTIRRVKRFSHDWVYGGVYMMNLFAFISPYPDDLLSCDDPIGLNDEWLAKISVKCKDTLFAWGNFKHAIDRAKIVSDMFPAAVCLGFNKNGTPKHPLYVPANTLHVNYK